MKALWVIGFMSSAFYVYIFFHVKFYADMGLNVYYLLVSIYGWIVWSKKSEKQEKKIVPIIRLNLPAAIKLTIVTGVLFCVMSFILSRYTDSPVPHGDAFTTALSVVATWMLAHKILEQWWVWIFVNIFSAGLYVWRDLHLTAFLFCCYAIASVIGYYKWMKSWKADNHKER